LTAGIIAGQCTFDFLLCKNPCCDQKDQVEQQKAGLQQEVATPRFSAAQLSKLHACGWMYKLPELSSTKELDRKGVPVLLSMNASSLQLPSSHVQQAPAYSSHLQTCNSSMRLANSLWGFPTNEVQLIIQN